MVHVFVYLPITILPYGPRGKVVKERPNRFVAETQVIVLYLFLGKEYGQAVFRGEYFSDVVFVFTGKLLVCNSRPSDPESLIRFR